MRRRIIYPAQNETQSLGQLAINVTTETGLRPIDQANVTLSRTGSDGQPIEVLTTDISGQTPTIELPTPPLDYSLEPESPQPYSEYDVRVDAPGFESLLISGTQILPNTTAIQDCPVVPEGDVSAQQFNEIIIDPHTLYGNFPPKIPEAEVKEDVEDSFIVLERPVVPGYIIVHEGPPDDTAGRNFYVPFKEYIKNVASSEIYSTWPLTTIQANILAILSFTLNRVYTEWYRSQGKNFTITNSTAYDQAFSYGRNLYANISAEVDALFINFISRPGIVQPLFTQYCDGSRVSCPNWLSQWGSKTLGDQGYSTINILKYYYGQDVFLSTAERVAGIPSSFPGTNLQLGSRGNAVRTIQTQLNAIANNYPAIPRVRVDGVFGPETQNAVEVFQRVFYLPVNGIVDYPTWYKISSVFVAVTRLANAERW